MEFKTTKKIRELEKRAEEALQQIDDKKYVLELEDDGYDIASSYGISFCGKDCCVMVRETTLENSCRLVEKDNMNTPTLETERLVLRKFTPGDMEALFLILKDEEVNQFLPWYPVKNMEETEQFYKERYASTYAQPQGYAYAICLKEDNFPIGYVKVDMEEHHDFGYGLRREFWHKGIVTEAGKAIVEQVKKDGLPYITATHDRNNPRSGMVLEYK